MHCGIVKISASFSIFKRPKEISTTLICLTFSLISLRVCGYKLTQPALRKTVNSRSLSYKMAMSSSPMKSDGESEVKLLLHEKDGSFFQRDHIGTKPTPVANGLKIISWNVAGLRGTLKKNPEVLNQLVDRQQPDLLCLQETKLQNIGDFGDLLVNKGYKSYWTYSEVKKGYAGTVIFVREYLDPNKVKEVVEAVKDVDAVEVPPPKKKPKKQAKLSVFFEAKAVEVVDDDTAKLKNTEENSKMTTSTSVDKNIPIGTVIVESVVYSLPDARFNREGRWVQIETPDFYFINTYVPNSGQNLERLDYRVDEWDVYVREYLNKLREKKPVIYSGDLNVAHTDLDVYNFQAKHLLKQAGTTLKEKNSFSELLSSGFYDALRFLYPAASGQFTYWSQRTRARPFNKGLRLDYFVCSKEMFNVVTDVKTEGNVVDEGKVDAVVEVKDMVKDDEVVAGSSSKKVKASKKRAVPESSVTHKEEEVEAVKATGIDSSNKVYENPTHVSVVDSYILPDENDCSDHCPIVLILQRKV